MSDAPEVDEVRHCRAALDAMAAAVRAVPDDGWDAPAPTCPGWSAGDVVGHVVGGLVLFQSLARGGASGPTPNPPRAMAGPDPAAAWTTAGAVLSALLTDPELPGRSFELPTGPTPGADLIGMTSVELLAHAHDLAVAAGIELTLDPDASAAALGLARRYDDVLRAPGMFGTPRPAPAGADPGRALLAYLGRDV